MPNSLTESEHRCYEGTRTRRTRSKYRATIRVRRRSSCCKPLLLSVSLKDERDLLEGR